MNYKRKNMILCPVLNDTQNIHCFQRTIKKYDFVRYVNITCLYSDIAMVIVISLSGNEKF